MATGYESILDQGVPTYGSMLNQPQPPPPSVLDQRMRMIDQTSSGQAVDPKAVAAADQEAATVISEGLKGLRRAGYSTIATTKAAIGQAIEPFAPETGQGMIQSGLRTMQEMPRDLAPAVPNWSDVHDVRSGALKAAGSLSEAAPTAAMLLGAGLLGRGAGLGVGLARGMRMADPALEALSARAGYGAGMAAMVPGDAGQTAMNIAQDPTAMANTTPAQRAALSFGRGTADAYLMNIVPQKLVVPNILGKAARIEPGFGAGLRNMALLAGEGAVGQYGAGAAQDLTGQYLANVVHPGTGYDLSQTHEAGLSGALLGGVLGAGAGAAGAVHSNIGAGVDLAKKGVAKVTDKLPSIPSLDDVILGVKKYGADPALAGQDLANATLGGLAKAAEAGGLIKQYGIKGLDTAEDVLGKTYDNVTKFAMKYVKDPEARQYFANKAADLKTMGLPEWEKFKSDLSEKSGREFMEDTGMAGAMLAKKTWGGVKDSFNYIKEATASYADTLVKGGDDGSKASMGGATINQRAQVMKDFYDAVPSAQTKTEEVLKGVKDGRTILANALHHAIEDPSYLAGAEYSKTRADGLKQWYELTGTSLPEVAAKIRAKRNVEAVRTATEGNLNELFAQKKVPDQTKPALMEMAQKLEGKPYEELPGDQRTTLLNATGGDETKARALHVDMASAMQRGQEAAETRPGAVKSQVQKMIEGEPAPVHDEHGHGQMDEQFPDRSPFNHEAFRNALVNERFAKGERGANTSLPVTLQPTNLPPGVPLNVQANALGGRRTNKAEWTKYGAGKVPVDENGNMRLKINPMSLTNMVASKPFRDQFAPHLPSLDQQQGLSASQRKAQRFMSALATLHEQGVHVDPERLGLPPGDPIHFKANVDLDQLHKDLIIHQKKGDKNPLTWGDISGQTWKAITHNKQIARLNELYGKEGEGDYTGAANKLRNSKDPLDQYLSRIAYARAMSDPEVSGKPTPGELDAAVKQYHTDLPKLKAEREARTKEHEYVNAAREAYANKDISPEQMDALIAHYHGAETEDAELTAEEKKTQAEGDRKNVGDISSVFHKEPLDQHNTVLAERLYDAREAVNKQREGYENTMYGKGEEGSVQGTITRDWIEHKNTAAQRAQQERDATERLDRERAGEKAAPVKKADLTTTTPGKEEETAQRQAKYAKGNTYVDPNNGRESPIKASFEHGDNTFVVVKSETNKSLWQVQEATSGHVVLDRRTGYKAAREAVERMSPTATTKLNEAIDAARATLQSKVPTPPMPEAETAPLTEAGKITKAPYVPGEEEKITPTVEPTKAEPVKVEAGVVKKTIGYMQDALDSHRETIEAMPDGARKTELLQEHAKIADTLHTGQDRIEKALNEGTKPNDMVQKWENVLERRLAPEGAPKEEAGGAGKPPELPPPPPSGGGKPPELPPPPSGPPGGPPPEPVKRDANGWTEAQRNFADIIDSRMGKGKTAYMFNQKDLPKGKEATYETRQQALDKIYRERNNAIEALKDARRNDEPRRAAELTAKIKSLDAQEHAMLTNQAAQGLIRLGTGMELKQGLAEHETFHAAFHIFFDANEKRILGSVFTRGIVYKRLLEHFKDDPIALKHIQSNAEEAAAYAFQIWSANPEAFQLGAQTTTMFQRFLNFFRKVLGVTTMNEKAQMILDNLNSGERMRTDLSPVSRTLDKDKAWQERAQDFAKTAGSLAKQGFDILFAPSYQRMVDTKIPPYAKIAKLIYEPVGVDGSGGGMIDRSRQVYKKELNQMGVPFRDLTEPQLKALHEAMIYDKAPTDPALTKQFNDLQTWYKNMYDYQIKAGVPLGNAGIKRNYYPLPWSPEKVMKNKKAFIDMLQDNYAEQLLTTKKTPNELYNSITSYIERGDDLVNVMGANNEPLAESSMTRSLNFIKLEHRVPFMDDDPYHTAHRYLKQAVRQAEYVRAFGVNGDKLTAMKNEATNVYGAKAEEQALVNDYIDGALGNKEIGMSRELKDLYGAVNVYQNYRLLPFNLLSSLIDPLGVAIRSNRATDAWETFTYSMKNLFKEWKKDYPRDFFEKYAEDVGIIEHSGTVSNANNLYDGNTMRGTTKSLNDKLFKYNLLSGWVRNNTIMAVKSGQRALYRAAEGDMGKHSARFLEELGVKDSDVVFDKAQNRILLHANELEAAGLSKEKSEEVANRLSQGINKFVRQALLNPNSAEMPVWVSNPYMMPVAHLKQFVFSFNATIMDRIMHEMEHGNFKPVALAAAYVPSMIAADFIKDMIANAGSVPPYKKDWGVADYINDGVQRSGLTGVGAFFTSAGEDISRGGGGWESAAGPMAGQMAKGFKAFNSGDSGAMKNWMVDALPLKPAYKHYLPISPEHTGGSGQKKDGGSVLGTVAGFADDAALQLAR